MEKVNYHTHCHLCGHAKGKAYEYAKEAIKHNFTCIGFSDHLPFPKNQYGSGMNFADIDKYKKELEAAKNILPSNIKMMSGFEGEYINGFEYYYEELLCKMGFEYLILGQHFVFNDNGSMQKISKLTDTSVYLDYANNVLTGMKTGYFSFIAHPDIVFMNNFVWDKNCEKACDLIIDAAVKYNYILEYNANGIRKGVVNFTEGPRRQYPYNKFWQKVTDTNIRVLVGSDCHAPNQLYDHCMQTALKEGNDLSLNIVTSF